MRNNETGEFELVVGNRQLLSGFFIVVLLFAVAFAMGYVVGQNSPRSAKAAAEAANPPVRAADAARPTPVVSAPPRPASPPPESDPPRTADAPQETATQPARE